MTEKGPQTGSFSESLLAGKSTTIFISHSHVDRGRAGELKTVLRMLGFSGFVAHEDIEPTLEWTEEILRQLKTCCGLVVATTENAATSPWVNQEIGAAVLRGVGIVSINFGAAPFGFLYRYQAVPWKDPPGNTQFAKREADEANVPALYRALERLDVAGIDHLVEGLKDCWSFEEARVLAAILGKKGPLNRQQAARLAYVVAVNSSVSGCWDAKRFLPGLLTPHKEFLPSEVTEILPKEWSLSGTGHTRSLRARR